MEMAGVVLRPTLGLGARSTIKIKSLKALLSLSLHGAAQTTGCSYGTQGSRAHQGLYLLCMVTSGWSRFPGQSWEKCMSNLPQRYPLGPLDRGPVCYRGPHLPLLNSVTRIYLIPSLGTWGLALGTWGSSLRPLLSSLKLVSRGQDFRFHNGEETNLLEQFIQSLAWGLQHSEAQASSRKQ